MLRTLLLVGLCCAGGGTALKCWEGAGKGEKVNECDTGTRNLNMILKDFGNFGRMTSALMGGESKCCFNVPSTGARGCWNYQLCQAAERNGKMGKCTKAENGKKMCVCNDKLLCNPAVAKFPNTLLLFFAIALLSIPHLL